MIARSWRGFTRSEDADTYLDYLHRTGVRNYLQTPGNNGVLVLRRIRDGQAEFQLITLWDSLEAVNAFAGPDVHKAVFYPEDGRFLVAGDEHVDHFEVNLLQGFATPAPRDVC